MATVQVPEKSEAVKQEESEAPPSAGAESSSSAAPASSSEKVENGAPKKGWPKGKKRKKAIKDSTAPRQPLTGYVRFLNDKREQVRAENPNLPFADITKTLAAQWSVLPQDEKQQYLTAAEQDRERYSQELAAYKQSEAYRIFSEQQLGKKVKEEQDESLGVSETNDSGLDIPIFTEEFLDFNKGREAELRQLRKSNTDYEQQNATIQTYLAGLNTAIEKLNVETQQQKSNNNALQQHLSNLRSAFTSIFSTIHVPGMAPPNPDNIDAYMSKLASFVKDNPSNPAVGSIRKAVMELDLQA